MSDPIACFFITPTDRAQLYLRRYEDRDSESAQCPHGYGYHDAQVAIEQAALKLDGEGCYFADAPMIDHADPRWPTACECGYVFRDGDVWQVRQEAIYWRGDTGEERPLREWGVGAMFYTDYLDRKGPDGHSLQVRTPGGNWAVDELSSTGGAWTRTGDVPLITVTPSIHFVGRYHGWLRDGVLIEC